MPARINVPTMLFLLCCTTAVNAQSAVELIAKQVGNACPQFVGRLTSHQGIALAAKERPLSESAACACAESRFASDPRLREHLNVDQQALKARLQHPSAKAYISLRLTETMLSCLATELDASANAVVLER